MTESYESRSEPAIWRSSPIVQEIETWWLPHEPERPELAIDETVPRQVAPDGNRIWSEDALSEPSFARSHAVGTDAKENRYLA